MSALTVRPAVAPEVAAIRSMLEQAALPAQDIDGGSVQFRVAERGGTLTGAIGLERFGGTGLLRSLVVEPASRDHGTGTALVRAVEREARETGIGTLVLLTQTARPFFERLGYSVIERTTVPRDVLDSAEFRTLCPASAVCMKKDLEPATVSRVLFLCTGNSCRSILGEATFNHLAPPGWRAMSAGSRPTGQVHPRSLALLAREGISAAGCHSKSWSDLPAAPDIVITVCASAAGETCPAYLGPVLRTHWGVDDPAHAAGTDEEIDAAFVTAYRTLRRRIEAMLELPLADLRRDPGRMKAELDRIGREVQ